VSSDKDFFQLADEETIIYRPIQKKFVSRKTLVEDFKIHPTNFALAKAIVGDKSDNVEGIRGAGFTTLAKKIPLFIEEDTKTITDIVQFCKDYEGKLKLFDKIVEQEEKIKENYKIVQLYSPLVSGGVRMKIRNLLSKYPFDLNKTQITKMMILDGIAQYNWTGMFANLQNISYNKTPFRSS